MNKIIVIMTGLLVVTIAFSVMLFGGFFGTLDTSIWAFRMPERAAAEGTFIPGTYTGVGSGGMNGDVTVYVTFSENEILELELGPHNETPSFAADAFDYVRNMVLALQAADGIDVVAGATLSCDAILNAVRHAISQADAAISYTPGRYTGVGSGGMNGDVTVYVTFSDSDIIDLELGQHNETPSFAADAFDYIRTMVLGLQTADGIDVVAGATLSCDAILNGVQSAIAQARGGSAPAPAAPAAPAATPAPTPEPTPTPELVTPSTGSFSFEPGTYTGVGQGFGGDLEVSITVNANTIQAVEIGANTETPDFLDMVEIATINLILSAQSVDVDAVTGATATSKGIIEAVGNAVVLAEGSEPEPEPEPTPEPAATPEPTAQPPSTPETPAAPAGRFTPGTYSGSGQGYNGRVTVSITVDADRITAVTISAPDDTPMFVGMVEGTMIGSILAAQSAEVDTVSGATSTSDGVKAGARAAISAASN